MGYFFHEDMRHFFVTRYNVAMDETEERTDNKRLDSEWLDRKLRLLSEITVPSMKNQSHKDFTWLMFVDSETLAIDQEKLLNLGCGLFQIVLCGPAWHKTLWDILTPILREGEPVITTRLDTDDAIHRDFAATIHRTGHQLHTPTAIDLTSGLLISNGSFIRRSKDQNQFASVLTPSLAHHYTIYDFDHTKLRTSFPTYHAIATDQPMWLLTNHEDSYTRGNRIRPDSPHVEITRAEAEKILIEDFNVSAGQVADLLGPLLTSPVLKNDSLSHKGRDGHHAQDPENQPEGG